jgi:hypothetical protein
MRYLSQAMKEVNPQEANRWLEQMMGQQARKLGWRGRVQRRAWAYATRHRR